MDGGGREAWQSAQAACHGLFHLNFAPIWLQLDRTLNFKRFSFRFRVFSFSFSLSFLFSVFAFALSISRTHTQLTNGAMIDDVLNECGAATLSNESAQHTHTHTQMTPKIPMPSA